MGSYLFHWNEPASEVYVTGTFDDWAKTIKLDKTTGNRHEKLVKLSKIDEPIFYKFVVDGNWTSDPSKPTEFEDGYGNNILSPSEITRDTAASNTMSNSATNTTVQGLAGQVPKQTAAEGAAEGVPGAYPETPANELSVNPLPATAGAGNPIQLRAGDPVPPASTITGNKINSAVTTDKASYERGVPVLPDVVTPEAERGAGLFGLPEQSRNMIPESSLPIAGGVGTSTINSVGAGATTTELAGQVPLEPRGVPEVVQESQAAANASPEASANPTAVQDKSAVEQELEAKVPEQPPADESTIGGKAAATIGAAAAGIGAAAAGAAAYMSSGKAKEDAASKLPAKEDVAASLPAKEDVKAKLPESVAPIVDKIAPTGAASTTAAAVPEVVKESIKESHASPEAAANTEAVGEKTQMESELLKSVKTEESAGAPAPTATAATTSAAPAATTTLMNSTEEPLRESARPTESAPAVPPKPAAASGTTAAGSAAPAAGAAAAGATALSAQAKGRSPSRDVSPMTRADGTHATQHVGPEVTTGVATSKTPVKSGAGAASGTTGPSSPLSTSSSKAEKRKSGLFTRIKEKLQHHDKKDKEKK